MGAERQDPDATTNALSPVVDSDERQPVDSDAWDRVGSRPVDRGPQGLPPLVWLFVAAAAVFGLGTFVTYAGSATPVQLLANALWTVGVALPVLLPAVLLRRIPDAPRRLPLLFGGLTLEALLWPLALFGASWSDQGEPLASIVRLVSQALGAAAPILVGLGLIRLRTRRPDRYLLLAGIALVYVAAGIVQAVVIVGPGASWNDAFNVAAAVGLPLMLPAAFAAWVPVAAWLDREEPRRFWALLAAGFPLWVAGMALNVAAMVATREQFGSTVADVGWIVFAIVGAAPSVLALVAYGWLTPVPAPPRTARPTAPVTPLAPA